jgi:hypothetical protein
MKKEFVNRGISVPDQFKKARRLSELTIGQSYLIKKDWLTYQGKQGKKYKYSP